MTKKLAATLSVFAFCMIMTAQEPVMDIDKKIHPNLAAAQQHIVEANRFIATAQKDNRFDMKDHAEKARQLLKQANDELKAAAQAANAGARRK